MNIMIFQNKIKDKINIIINIKKKFILLKFISRILLIINNFLIITILLLINNY